MINKHKSFQRSPTSHTTATFHDNVLWRLEITHWRPGKLTCSQVLHMTKIVCMIVKFTHHIEDRKQASQQGTIFGVATQHLLHLAADRRVYLMLILHLKVSSSDSSEVERLASILGDPRSIPPISKNIFVGNWAWFGLAILLSNSASSQNKAPCWEVWMLLCITCMYSSFGYKVLLENVKKADNT